MTAPLPPLAVCSWSLLPDTPQQLVNDLKQLNLSSTQLALDPLLDSPAAWGATQTLLAQHNISIVSGMFGTVGEDYSTLESIRATGGIVPDATWPTNQQRIQQHAARAGQLGLSLVTFHAGFLPENPSDPNYAKLLDRVSWIAQQFAQHRCDVAFETGQETAKTLCTFLDALGQPNVGANFDPANMILYGKGNPVTACQTLLHHIKQVHLKDATAARTPGTWGTEVPLGLGDVDWPAFFQVLTHGQYTGGFSIEREAGPTRATDIATARDQFYQYFK